ncbi:MAG: hypothetical protein JNK04_14205 [Myxococcales bacterium]|nr:hypothetical protein [Myxococcales bacterium]
MTGTTEDRLLDAEVLADEMAAYLDGQEDPEASKWNDPRAICDMMRALIKNIRLGLIADPDSVGDLEEELESTLKSARAWMCAGPAPSAPTAPPPASRLMQLEEDDLDLPASAPQRDFDRGSPLSQRVTARPPPGQAPEDVWDKAPGSASDHRRSETARPKKRS